MKYKDIPKNTWFEIDKNSRTNQWSFRVFLYKTNIKIDDEDIFLEVWKNTNNPWSYGMTLKSDMFWEEDNSRLDIEDPPGGEIKASRECLKYLFEIGIK